MWTSAAFLTACLFVAGSAIPPGFVSRANRHSYRRSKTRASRDRCYRIPFQVDQHQHQVQEQQEEGRRRCSNRPPVPSFSLTSLSAGVLVDSTGFGAAPPGDDREARASRRLKQQQQQQQQQQQKKQPPTRVRKRPLVDAKQLSSQEVRLRWPNTDFEVPRNMSTAVITFFQKPTPKMVTLGILGVVAARFSCDDALSLVDAAAFLIVAIGWSFQEWAFHKYLLHDAEGWMGHDIHQSHHDKPFYHVCVDPPDLVAGWTVAAAGIFRLLLPTPLALTVLAAYMVMGLLYEWTHYIVHTRVIPRSELWKHLKRHHTLHHLKDESCWMAFMFPAIDTLFGTVPADETAGRRQPDVRVESDDSRLGDDYYRHC